MAKLNATMFKPSQRKPKNMGRMTSADMRKEYTKQAKVANRRMQAIAKAGLYSPAVANLRDRGIQRFGIKNQGLVSDKEIRKAYRELMDFLGSSTSSKTGIKQTADKMIQNFGLQFNGDYVEFSQKSKKVFDLYEDLREMSKRGEIKSHDKYDIVADLDTLYEAGFITEDTTAGELVAKLDDLAQARRDGYNAEQSLLKFNWKV